MPTPYFDDSYAVNSANAGPYGDAITQELIPYVERHLPRYRRGLGAGGLWRIDRRMGSSGLAGFYPDFYNGAYVFCPDVVDFRAYMTMNLYDDKNAFYVEGPFASVPRPSVRQADGLLLSTMAQMNRFELVQGTRSRSGEQLDAWQAYFSSVGEDGYPAPVFDKRTGEIDHKVAEYFKEHYDLTHIMERDWKTLGPKLAGKLHLFVGDADTFYLDRAVHLTAGFHGVHHRSVLSRNLRIWPAQAPLLRRKLRSQGWNEPALHSGDGEAHGGDGSARSGSHELEVLTAILRLAARRRRAASPRQEILRERCAGPAHWRS